MSPRESFYEILQRNHERRDGKWTSLISSLFFATFLVTLIVNKIASRKLHINHNKKNDILIGDF